MFPVNTTREHVGRRAFLKATLATAGGMAVANWGGRLSFLVNHVASLRLASWTELSGSFESWIRCL